MALSAHSYNTLPSAVHLREVSAQEGCPLKRGVRLKEVYTKVVLAIIKGTSYLNNSSQIIWAIAEANFQQ